jgi:phosphatidylglycerol lysyltransferase
MHGRTDLPISTPARGAPPSAVASAATAPQAPGSLARTAAVARRNWLVWIIAAGILANGVLEVLSSLRIRSAGTARLAFSLPFGIAPWGRTATVVLGFSLIFFSFHLLRRRRLAWWLAVVALAAVTVVHIVWSHHALLAVGSLLVLALLMLARRRYTVRFEPRGIVSGLQLTLITFVAAMILGSVAFYLLDEREFGREFALSEALTLTLRQFAGLGNAGLTPLTPFARWFPRLVTVLGVTAEALALFALFRPVVYRVGTEHRQRRRARKLVHRYGRSTYDYFKTWDDKSLYFPFADGFVGYRVLHNVAVALGDPVADPRQLQPAIESFVRFARDNGWIAVFLMPDDPVPYQSQRLWQVKIGEEATVDLERFAGVTANGKYFRRVRRQAEEKGLLFSRHQPPHPRGLIEEVESLSAEWMSQAHYREFGFVQGTMDRAYLQASVLDLLRDPDGRLVAFINEVPSFAPGEASFDMMRRLPGAHWAAMDYLFLRAMLELRGAGFTTFNLGLAPFAGVGDDRDSALLEKTMHALVPLAQRLAHTEGISQYKKKFAPDWRERLVIYDGGPLALPKVALALFTVV